MIKNLDSLVSSIKNFRNKIYNNLDLLLQIFVRSLALSTRYGSALMVVHYNFSNMPDIVKFSGIKKKIIDLFQREEIVYISAVISTIALLMFFTNILNMDKYYQTDILVNQSIDVDNTNKKIVFWVVPWYRENYTISGVEEIIKVIENYKYNNIYVGLVIPLDQLEQKGQYVSVINNTINYIINKRPELSNTIFINIFPTSSETFRGDLINYELSQDHAKYITYITKKLVDNGYNIYIGFSEMDGLVNRNPNLLIKNYEIILNELVKEGVNLNKVGLYYYSTHNVVINNFKLVGDMLLNLANNYGIKSNVYIGLDNYNYRFSECDMNGKADLPNYFALRIKELSEYYKGNDKIKIMVGEIGVPLGKECVSNLWYDLSKGWDYEKVLKYSKDSMIMWKLVLDSYKEFDNNLSNKISLVGIYEVGGKEYNIFLLPQEEKDNIIKYIIEFSMSG